MTKRIIITMLMIVTVQMLQAQYLDDAKQLMESERYNSAEILLEKKLENTAPEPEINYLLVKSYLEQDKIAEAGRYVAIHLPSAINENADPLNRVSYARYLLNAGKQQEAEDIFSSLFSEKKNQKDAHLLLRMADVAIGEEDGNAALALTWLAMAKKRDKQNAEIDIARGLAYRKLGDATHAFLAYQDALRNDPHNVRAYYLMGKIFAAQKNPDVYMEYFIKAYGVDSTYGPVLEELYHHYYPRNAAVAKKYLEKFIENTDYALQNDYSMTDMLYLTGEYQKAIGSANAIIHKEQLNAQPRLYKLKAYSYTKTGDSASALRCITDYLAKEDPNRIIAADFQLIAQLMENYPGQEDGAIVYYGIAAEMDTLASSKAKYASAIAALYKKKEDYSRQAHWLGKFYQWKKKSNNVDLFNWGLAYYMAKDYRMTDSVFALYTGLYPEDIFGYYWRALANASADTSMAAGLAIPFYRKVAELGEKDSFANKKMLLKAYGYLGGYEANVTRNYAASLAWFEKYYQLEENADVSAYIESLRKWLTEKK